MQVIEWFLWLKKLQKIVLTSKEEKWKKYPIKLGSLKSHNAFKENKFVIRLPTKQTNPPGPRPNFPRKEREVENEKSKLEESSPDNKKINVIVEYYVLKPLASSESPSSKSKGARFVSATKVIF